MQDNKYYWIWISQIQAISQETKKKLLKKYTIHELYNLNIKDVNLKSEYFKENNITEGIITELTNNKYKEKIEYYAKTLENMNINIITYYDLEYPSKLKQIYDYPLYIFCKGNLELLNTKSIAIVGSRNATNYGRMVAKKIASGLSNRNITIISGGARGIDTSAHYGALEIKKPTVLIKGNSLEYIYPPENKELEEYILQNKGLLLSEYLFGTRPNKYTFPERNRLISGLADGVVVVEAMKNSGALITADLALSYNREVYAVPRKYNK